MDLSQALRQQRVRLLGPALLLSSLHPTGAKPVRSRLQVQSKTQDTDG